LRFSSLARARRGPARASRRRSARGSFFVRSKSDGSASIRGASVERLAQAAKVSPTWLLTGRGPREGDSDELAPFDAARALFLAQESHDGRGDEARRFLADRTTAYAGAERKSPRWWLETLAEEFREWRTARDKCSEWCDRKRGTTSKSFALRF